MKKFKNFFDLAYIRQMFYMTQMNRFDLEMLDKKGRFVIKQTAGKLTPTTLQR